EAWTCYEGRHWADHYDRFDAGYGGFNDHLLVAAAIGPRDRVLYIGSRCGQITRIVSLQSRLGLATGVEVSGPILARARPPADREGVENIAFHQGDAQVYPFPDAAFDAAVSRFGIMFFADPVAAFGNIRRALREGGRLAFLSLAPMTENDMGKVLE